MGHFLSVQAITSPRQEHLEKLCELSEEGNLRPFVDKIFPIKDIVAAHEYVDNGRKRGIW
ncbi:MAG: zinc-binding dehydrogenase [Saprospiraceae bacterium]